MKQRFHIPMHEKLAAALSMLLSQEERDVWREAKASAAVILTLFDFDHNILHAHDGPDRWWNLTPMLRTAHREKSKRDVAIVAKVKRLQRKRKRPRRKLRSRGFDKRRTRKFSGEVVPRR
jgi:hypothetical protein